MSALPRYERPSIQRHRSGMMNKVGAGPALRPQETIDGVSVRELVETYGSPLFVYSQRTLEKRVRDLRDQLTRRWPRVCVAWSYKTCYLDAVCQTFHAEGSWAEAVSGMEVRKALRNGVPMSRVVFNGPHKDDETLREALIGGAMVNVDHFDEIARCEAIAESLGARPGVGIRLNLAAGTAPRWDRFGFNLDSGQAWDAVRRITGGGHLQIKGLHCHIGTYIQDADAYRDAADQLARFANRLRAELGITIAYIDLGGGFASRANLKGSYLPGAQTTPSMSQYAEAIATGLSSLAFGQDELPLLIVETGRALVDDAGTMIATVVANKRLGDGRRAMVLDAGVNVLFTSYWYQHEIVPAAPFYGVPEPTVVLGPLCMNIDVVCEQLTLPPLEAGDQVVIRTVGAYNVTQSMTFIHLQPAVVMIGRDGQHGVIRRAQTLDDLCEPESVPAWLADRR
jgi:diaminopimelate decarboxylase